MVLGRKWTHLEFNGWLEMFVFYDMNLMILHFAKLSQGEKVTFMGEKPTTTKDQACGD